MQAAKALRSTSTSSQANTSEYARQQFGLDFAPVQRTPQKRGHRSYLLAAQAAGLDRRKVAQVGSHIQGQTVRRDPVPHVDADRRHLGRADPSTGQATPSLSLPNHRRPSVRISTASKSRKYWCTSRPRWRRSTIG